MGDSKGDGEVKRLDWIYRDASQVVDPEEYLLGRKVDKQIEKRLLPPDKEQECLPTSIFSGTLPPESQVDIARKLQEDPLYLIKKREEESRAQLLKNPRKLKQLQEMVAKQRAAAEKLKKKQMKKMKKLKKNEELDSLLAKKCKKLLGGLELKKLAELSSGNSSDDDGVVNKNRTTKDLDKILAKKYKQLLGKSVDAKGLAEISSDSDSESGDESKKKVKRIKKSSSSSSSDTSISSDERKRKKRKRNRSKSPKTGSKKNRQKDRANRDFEVVTNKEERLKTKSGSKIDKKHSSKYTSSESEEYDAKKKHKFSDKSKRITKSSSDESSKSLLEDETRRKKSKYPRGKKESESRENKIAMKRSSNTKDSKEYEKNEKINSKKHYKSLPDRDKKSKRRERSNSSSSSESSSENNKTVNSKRHKFLGKRSDKASDGSYSSEEGKKVETKKYGLVLPDNYVPKKKPKEEVKNPAVQEKKEDGQYKREKKVKLSEEEKQKRLAEMMGNAKWREELRDKNIKAYEEKLKTEDSKDTYVYNENFMRSQMAHAISKETVESRIKANINTIQRGKDTMDRNFARRH